MKSFRKLNLKQPKYVIPLIALPFLLFIVFQLSSFTENKAKTKEEPQKELSTSLGDVDAEILNKNEAYDRLFKNLDSRTILDGLEDETDSTYYYSDSYTLEQKRIIDSLTAIRKLNERAGNIGNPPLSNYYQPGKETDDDYQRQKDMMDLLYGNRNQNNSNAYDYDEPESDEPVNQLEILKQQMFFLDSLEAAKDPERQKEMKIQEKLKANQQKWDDFMNSTLRVEKGNLNSQFNTISNQYSQNTIKAIIDENIKGYLGSRIRLRLLEDVQIGKHRIPSGSFLYAQITGFTDQRVNLSVLSVYFKDEILPVNLTLFDIDGLKGLYVPHSNFREMLKEMGTTSVQGQSVDFADESFSTSLLKSLFTSTSNSLAALIRKNKAKLKYNSYILLINEKDLKNESY
ncbi:MAG: conjugative transposon protein TraM [Weeksellaceae bacterium]